MDAGIDLRDPQRRIKKTSPDYSCIDVNERDIISKQNDFYALIISVLEMAGLPPPWLEKKWGIAVIVAKQKAFIVKFKIPAKAYA